MSEASRPQLNRGQERPPNGVAPKSHFTPFGRMRRVPRPGATLKGLNRAWKALWRPQAGPLVTSPETAPGGAVRTRLKT